MKKNIFKTLCILMLTLIIDQPTASADNRFILNPIEVTAGETSTLSIELDNETTFYGFQADIFFPIGIEVVRDNSKSDICLSDRFDQSFSLISNLFENNHLRLGAFSSAHKAIEGNNGIILNIKVKVSDSFEGGDLTINNILCITEDDQDVKLSDVSTFIYGVILPNELKLNHDSAQLKVGETISLTATIIPENSSDKSVTWTSSD
ncbi:MAG: Ig-like domain-containing protein, partial [Muribaculaceae bacterium]|nr:Ig-like domain-containing protein [Muribaculaceae bacterium]